MPINVLPDSYRNSYQHERWMRFTVLSGIFFALLFTVGIILLLPSFFFLYFQSVAREGEVLNDRSAEIQQLRDSLLNSNKIVADVALLDAPSIGFLEAYEAIFTGAYGTISLSGLDYHRETRVLNIRGVAATRTDLQQFEKHVKSRPEVEIADIPITFFTPRENNTFTATVTFKLPNP